ncbi:MAG: aldo/keto reductase [Thermodesulfobacteriota bacterium]|jgi:aryl-alcohol dehydrogenase-like predicted oxidoreductase|nr:MAG: aldo/keto reductase [Thermodesulfobacteriota bacterium]
MRYDLLGSTNLKVSVVSLGTWVMGGDNWGKVDDYESIASIQKAIALGINLIDTAPAYGDGHAEEIVGKAIKGNRDKVFIATKCGLRKKEGGFAHDLSPSGIQKELEDSLLRLGIDYIDLYQCHWPDPMTPIETTLEEMLKMRSEGKINHIGVSNFDQPLLEKALRVAPVVSLQSHYSMLERMIEKNHLMEFCNKNGVGIMTYGSLGGGLLTGKYKNRPTFSKKDARRFFYPFYNEQEWKRHYGFVEAIRKIAQEKKKPLVEVALNWLIQQAGVTTALVGARNREQVEKNAQAIQWELSESDLVQIEKIYHNFF